MQESQEPLAQLCAPLHDSRGALRDGLGVLQQTLAQQSQAVGSLLQEDQSDARRLFGAFAARKLLEAATAALLARLDPPRFLILYEYQRRQGTDYDLGKPHSAAFAWANEVVGTDTQNKTGNTLWQTEVNPKDFTRALLRGHLAEVCWPTAIQRVCRPDSDGVANNPESKWLDEIRARFESKCGHTPDQTPSQAGWSVMCALRDRARGLYSELSKGVHVEFLVPDDIIFDAETVAQKLTESLKLCAQLGYLSNYIDTIATRLPAEEADAFLLLVEQSCDV